MPKGYMLLEVQCITLGKKDGGLGEFAPETLGKTLFILDPCVVVYNVQVTV